MSGYVPQAGDRVSVACMVLDVAPNNNAVYVDLFGGACRWLPTDRLALLERPAPVEGWLPGDVVRNAADPEDKRSWTNADPGTAYPWVSSSYKADNAWWFGREQLPATLQLLVRAGQPVPQPDTKTVDPGECGSRGPRVGDDGTPICRELPGHTGMHLSGVNDGFPSRVAWGGPK